ncbi:MAG: molybdopterin-guanine dinucleotide biosynthesis protein B [Candidatus Bathyarchaeia archaeon]
MKKEGALNLYLSHPTIAVLGRKSSGKTTVIEHLVPKLIREGFSVATIKHIAHEGFSIDREGSDTWRHSASGANPVVSFSNWETSIIIKTLEKPLEKIIKILVDLGANVLVLEGFSSVILKEKSVGKIVCVRSLEEYEEFKQRSMGEVIAFCSLHYLNEHIINLEADSAILVVKALNFVRKRMKVIEILNSLPRLNCGRCGRKTCEELAEDIYYGSAKNDDCIIMKVEPELKTSLKIDGKNVPLQPFVSEFIRRTVLGMISTLKNVDIKGDEKIHVEVFKSSGDSKVIG